MACYSTNESAVDWHYSCDENFYNLHDWLFFSLAVVSHVLLLLLSQRGRNSKYANLCKGRPGVIFPMNMLDGCEDRLAYCAAFGAMTFELSSILWNPYGRFTSFGLGYQVKANPIVSQYPSLRVLLLLAQVLLCTYLFSPLFFTLATRYRFIGSLLGVVISLFKMTSMIWLSTCLDTEHDIFSAGFRVKKYLLVILLWPCIVSLAVLFSQYVLIIIQCIRKRQFGAMSIRKHPVAASHHNEHVRYLLGKAPLPWKEKNLQHLSIFSREKLRANFEFRRMPGFKFPTRVLATFTFTVLAVYQVGMQVVFRVYSMLKVVRRYIRCANQLLPADVYTYLAPYADKIYEYANIAANMWVGCSVFTMLLGIAYVYHMCLCYRKHMLRSYRGDVGLFPKNWLRESNHTVLTCASRHAGLQIAYTIWGLVIIQIFLFLIMSVLVFVIIIPAADFDVYAILNWILHIVIITLILNQAIYWTQLLLNRFLFLQGKVNVTDMKPPLAIDNRNIWYNLSFFFFFWNLFLGIISALMRILKGLVLGVFFIPRIDRPVLMRGFETFDNGFYSYLSLLSVINTHDHPVVKVFVQILLDSVKQTSRNKMREMRNHSSRVKSATDGETICIKDNVTLYTKSSACGRYHLIGNDVDEMLSGAMLDLHGNDVENGASSTLSLPKRNTSSGSKRARYYWFLAYTLIHNPDLLNYRKIEVEGASDTPACMIRKHKIVLAVYRKQQGEKTSDLYKSL